MIRRLFILAVPLVACVSLQAAAISTTLTVNATATVGTSIVATGTASLTNGIGSGTFTATFSVSTFSGPYTITLSGGTITGTITTSAAILTGSATGSATVTGGTGTYSGATGSFPNLAGTGALGQTGAITLTFTGAGTINTGGSGGPTAPTITKIQNNYSYILPGFPNYGIAPGTIFIVGGTGLADPNAQAVLQSSGGSGIPLTLNGASATVTVNGTTVHPGFYYAIAAQVALVLPSNTPTGTGTLTMSYNGTPSTPATITVVPSALGLDSYYGTGTGLGVATDPLTGVPYDYSKSMKPGDVVVLWGSGLGGITADSDTVFTTTPHASTSPLQIFIGGLSAVIGYKGNSGFPGLNQINVTVPLGVTPGCNVSLVAVSGTVISNVITLPVSANGGACSDAVFGSAGATLSSLSGKSTVKSGFVAVAHTVSSGQTADAAIASFSSTTGASFGASSGSASVGSCIVSQAFGSSIPSTTTPLNAGSISLSGPGGTQSLQSFLAGTYIASLPAGFIPSAGGNFTFTATAGSDVGSFSAPVNYTSPATWTNQSANATVSRAAGTTVTWAGGAAGAFVTISGSATATVSGQQITGSYTCIAPATALTFTVPNWATLGLPAGSGSTTFQYSTPYQPFTASGLDIGFAEGFSSTQINVTYN